MGRARPQEGGAPAEDLASQQPHALRWDEENLTPRLYVSFRHVSGPWRAIALGPYLRVDVLGGAVLAESLEEDGKVKVVELARREGEGWRVEGAAGDAPPYPWLRIHTNTPPVDAGELNGQH